MEDIIVSGSVEDIIFQNKDTGFIVFTIQSDTEEIICVGNIAQLNSGETIKVTGNWVVHPTYGKQLQVQDFEKILPTTEEEIERYLSSGVLKGIGPKTAKKIVRKFGADTFYIMEEKPERLAEIKGITYEKAMEISTVFQEQHQLRQAMIFLQEYGISPAYAIKIYKKYKGKVYDVLKTNPYRLADDILGIGFKMADKFASTAGISSDSPYRIQSGIKFVLNQASNNGHTFLPKELVIEKTSKLLSIVPELIENSILELQLAHQIYKDKIENQEMIYLNSFYYAELACAKRLLELAQDGTEQNQEQIEKRIVDFEKENSLLLASEQKKAVKEAMVNGLLIITGGPGTGKTTTINTILNLMQEEDNEILLAAPTGRAAKRMTEATGTKAQTIHRLLGINFVDDSNRRQTFDRNEDNPIEADVVIIDETSMVDILLFHSLLRAIAPGTRLILVGDVDQLPSVGPGNVLKDIIRSGKLKVVRLNEIFRQAQQSAIVMNAHRINQGMEPVLNEKEKDFFFLKRANAEDVVSTIIQLAIKRLPRFTSCDPIKQIQILTPMRKGLVGVQNLNEVLQNALNPPKEDKKEKEYRSFIFRVGDKVMQIKNNYNLAWKIYNSAGKRIEEGIGVFNGDEGIILDIDERRELVIVLFDENKQVDYDFTQLDELELAYAITIHKSQGSEYPVIILPVHSGPPMLMSRNLLYTAITRAKQLVVIVGLSDTMYRMIQNNREINRYSSLSYRICNLYDAMYPKGEEA